MSDLAVLVWIFYGYVVLGVVLYVAIKEVRDRWGRVPVIEPAWFAIRDVIDWCLRVPGRVLRWLRPRDTPRGTGGP